MPALPIQSTFNPDPENTISVIISDLLTGLELNSGSVNIPDIVFHSDYREICSQNVCRCYGTSWACPPGVGTQEECIARLRSYEKMILFSRAYQLEDSFDIEGIQESGSDFRERVELFAQKVNPHLPHYLMMANGGCHKCNPCTYPDAPCRFPDQVFHSMSSYMFTVSAVAKQAGLIYNNGPDTVTFFGAILFHESK